MRILRGYTAVELLVVIAFLGFLLIAAAPKFWNFLNTYQLNAAVDDLTHALRLAQQRSMSAETGSAWSMHLVSGSGGSFTLYQGTNYSGRNTDHDILFTLPSSLSLSYTVPDADVTFTKIEGNTTDTGTITLSWPGAGISRIVTINSVGRIDPP